MLQFFDDLPSDRWAAFLEVERRVRKNHWAARRRTYVQMTLVAAYELKLRILPEWQSEIGLLHALGIADDDDFAPFDRDLALVTPKIQWLADQKTAPLTPASVPLATRELDIRNYRGPDHVIRALGEHPTMNGPVAIKTGTDAPFICHTSATTIYRAAIPYNKNWDDMTLEEAVVLLDAGTNGQDR